MKLDRNIANNDGRGKYALLKMRQLMAGKYNGHSERDVNDAISLLEEAGLIEYGTIHTPGEFFVLKLRDKYSFRALNAYASGITQDDDPVDTEYAAEILALMRRAGPNSPFCKRPD